MKTILIDVEADRLTEVQVQQIQAAAPDMRVLWTHDRSQIEAALDDIEIAVGGFPHDLLPRARKLRWMQQWGAGADWLQRAPEAAKMDFVLTSASGVHAIPISEQILGYLLAFARGLHRAVRAQVKREWHKETKQTLFELADKTMLLIGVGAIGGRTAELAAALALRVLGLRRDPSLETPGIEAMYGPDQLLDVLPQADIVVITAPLTDETRGMLGPQELRAMRPTAYLVNIGRGGTVQEEALVRALKEGWIAGAGLDVFATEPLRQDSLLWEMENVIVTAHYAGMTPRYDERALSIFLDNLRRYRTGQPLVNVVDKVLGY